MVKPEILLSLILVSSISVMCQTTLTKSFIGAGGNSISGDNSLGSAMNEPFAGVQVASGNATLSSGFIGGSPRLVPTGMLVFISGRVVTTNDHGLPNVLVSLSDETGLVHVARTGGFGYFTFQGVESGRVYVISVSSKSYQFEPRVLLVLSDMSNVDFVPLNTERQTK